MCVVMPTTTTTTQALQQSASPKAEQNNNNTEDTADTNTQTENRVDRDDFGSTDEVKVFNDEDERDGDATESYQAELQA